MFDISLLDQFYTFECNKNDGTPFDVTENVKEAYFIFVKDFCVNVSTVWKKYLKGFCQTRDTATFVQKLTKSDEAYAYWLYSCLFEKCVPDATVVEQHGWEKWNQDRKKGKAGKHDSVTKFDEYVLIYNKISALRENHDAYQFWQNIFFEKLFKKTIQESKSKVVVEKTQEKKIMVSIPQNFD